MICSVLTVDAEGLLHPLAGPSLPQGYFSAPDGIAIGRMLARVAAAYCGAAATVTDIGSDSRWAKFKNLALPVGLRVSSRC